MARARKTYPKEFRRRMVELVRAGRSAEELAKEFEPSAKKGRNPAERWLRACWLRFRPSPPSRGG
jgi:transposase-like protein